MTDTILLIAGAVPTTERMIAYAIAAAERAKEKGWGCLMLGDAMPELHPYVTMVGNSADPFLADEYAMELCDKILLIGSDARIEAMAEYILTLYDKELWWTTFRGNDASTMHKITQSQPEPEQMRMF